MKIVWKKETVTWEDVTNWKGFTKEVLISKSRVMASPKNGTKVSILGFVAIFRVEKDKVKKVKVV